MIQYDEDAPRTDASFWNNATLSIPEKKTKQAKSMRFDPDLYEWYKQRAQSLNMPTQSLMHKVLESWEDHESTEEQ